MSRTRIKVCGITRTEDAQAAVRAGADAIGLVFHSASPRCVTTDQAREILLHLPPFVTAVGLFVDAAPAQIEQVVTRVPLGLLQFHGAESPQDCLRYGLPFIKACHMTPGVDLRAICRQYEDASAILVDTAVAGIAGGTGQVFDWNLIPRDLPKPLVVAGGLTADNVAAAIAQLNPYAVDVSSGVEVSKGIKSPEKMAEFVAAVYGATKS